MLGSNCRASLRDGLVTLDLTQLKPEDSGVYKLVCRNQSGEISCSCRLMVYEVVKEDLVPPLFTMPIKGKRLLRYICPITKNIVTLSSFCCHIDHRKKVNNSTLDSVSFFFPFRTCCMHSQIDRHSLEFY